MLLEHSDPLVLDICIQITILNTKFIIYDTKFINFKYKIHRFQIETVTLVLVRKISSIIATIIWAVSPARQSRPNAVENQCKISTKPVQNQYKISRKSIESHHPHGPSDDHRCQRVPRPDTNHHFSTEKDHHFL